MNRVYIYNGLFLFYLCSLGATIPWLVWYSTHSQFVQTECECVDKHLSSNNLNANRTFEYELNVVDSITKNTTQYMNGARSKKFYDAYHIGESVVCFYDIEVRELYLDDPTFDSKMTTLFIMPVIMFGCLFVWIIAISEDPLRL